MAVWFSAGLVYRVVARQGTVVFRWMTLSTTPPSVSMPSDSGTTSSSSVCRRPPDRMSACTAAPRATTSSGFSSAVRRLAEELADPPADQRHPRRAADQHDFVDLVGGATRRRAARLRTASASGRPAARPASRIRIAETSAGNSDSALARRATNSADSAARQRDLQLLGPVAQVLQQFRVCARRSVPRSLATTDMIARSKSSPPRSVSPLVLSTLKTPSVMRQHRAIERAAAEVVHGHGAAFRFGPARRRGRRPSAR